MTVYLAADNAVTFPLDPWLDYLSTLLLPMDKARLAMVRGIWSDNWRSFSAIVARLSLCMVENAIDAIPLEALHPDEDDLIEIVFDSPADAVRWRLTIADDIEPYL